MDNQEENKKNGLAEFITKHPKAYFIMRAILWVLLAAIMPFIFIAKRFEIFDKSSPLHLGGWGFIAIVIIIIVSFRLFKYITSVLKIRKPFATQCLSGMFKIIIPMIAIILLLKSLKNNIDVFVESFAVIILFEAMAIPVNPFPVWVYEKQKELSDEDKKDTVQYIASKLKLNKKDKK